MISEPVQVGRAVSPAANQPRMAVAGTVGGAVAADHFRLRASAEFRGISPGLLMMMLMILLMMAVAGCGGADGPVRYPVSGKVTLDGTPLSSGVIRLVPVDQESPGAFAQIRDGEFQFTEEAGPVEATYRVEIEAAEHTGFEIDDEAAFATAMQKTGRSPMADNPVPATYNRASTLTAEVTGDTGQEFQFDLSSR